MSRVVIALALAAAAVAGSPLAARADVLGSRENQPGHITRIGQGVFQLGADGMFTSSYQSEEDGASLFRANVIGRGMFRYFVKDNLGVGAHLGVLFRKTGDLKDVGFVGDVSARYHARLGEGMFWAPELTLGLEIGSRSVELPGTGLSASADLVGFLGGVKLPLVFFISPRFSVEAGPEILLTVGSTTPEAGEGTGFTAVDGGFSIGAVYSF